MKNQKFLLLILITAILCSCSITRYQKKGKVRPESFNYETEFTTVKTCMILPFEINGVSKNFLFDTGADVSIIQRDSIVGEAINLYGSTNRSEELGSEYVKSLKIGEVDFRNTFAINGNLVGLKEQIPNFGGLIGQSIIKKANWLIDYPNKKLRISNQNLAEESFTTLKITTEGGKHYTYITINGADHKVLIDFGSSSEFNLPEESELAKELFIQYHFDDNVRERYSIGGLQTTKEKVGVLPLIKLGNLSFENVNTTINVSSRPRIGIAFFKDCIIYIDNANNTYKIRK